jgi:hypothetical protein
MVGRAILLAWIYGLLDFRGDGCLVGSEGIATVHQELREFLVDFVIEVFCQL